MTYRRNIPLILLIITTLVQVSAQINVNLDIIVAALAILTGFQYFVDARAYREKVDKELEEKFEAFKQINTETYENFKVVIEQRDEVLRNQVEVLEQRMSKLDLVRMSKPKQEPNFF